MEERRLVRREDSVRENRAYATLDTATEITTPDTYTSILAVEITLHSQSSVVVYTGTSVTVKSPLGYGKVRVTWEQGGTRHTIPESEGFISPFGERYHSELVITELTVGSAVGITLEAQPFGGTLSVDRANLLLEEW